MLQRAETRDTLRRAALDAPPARDFAGALRRADGRLAVIAEIKRRSPSKGELAPDLDPAATRQGVRGGRRRRAVGADRRPFFGGSVDDLQAARAKVELPGAAQGLHDRRDAGLRGPGDRRRRRAADRGRAPRRRAARRPPRARRGARPRRAGRGARRRRARPGARRRRHDRRRERARPRRRSPRTSASASASPVASPATSSPSPRARSAPPTTPSAWPRPGSTPCSWARRSFAPTIRPRSCRR